MIATGASPHRLLTSGSVDQRHVGVWPGGGHGGIERPAKEHL